MVYAIAAAKMSVFFVFFTRVGNRPLVTVSLFAKGYTFQKRMDGGIFENVRLKKEPNESNNNNNVFCTQ